MFNSTQRTYLETARVGRLATADGDGRPHAVPVCFALCEERIVSPIDEKPKDNAPSSVQRIRNIEGNPYVALVVDHYSEEWSQLGWLLLRGQASGLDPGHDDHPTAVATLRGKYEQYADHALEDRPIVQIAPGSVQTWGTLERPQ